MKHLRPEARRQPSGRGFALSALLATGCATIAPGKATEDARPEAVDRAAALASRYRIDPEACRAMVAEYGYERVRSAAAEGLIPLSPDGQGDIEVLELMRTYGKDRLVKAWHFLPGAGESDRAATYGKILALLLEDYCELLGSYTPEQTESARNEARALLKSMGGDLVYDIYWLTRGVLEWNVRTVRHAIGKVKDWKLALTGESVYWVGRIIVEVGEGPIADMIQKTPSGNRGGNWLERLYLDLKRNGAR